MGNFLQPLFSLSCSWGPWNDYLLKSSIFYFPHAESLAPWSPNWASFLPAPANPVLRFFPSSFITFLSMYSFNWLNTRFYTNTCTDMPLFNSPCFNVFITYLNYCLIMSFLLECNFCIFYISDINKWMEQRDWDIGKKFDGRDCNDASNCAKAE